MTAQTSLSNAAHTYLQQVQRLLEGADSETAVSLMAGLTEELEGLDDAAALSKIEQIGPPEEVTAELRADAEPRPQDADWYTWLAALLATFGGFILPFIGWIVGVVLLWNSKTWRTRHRVIGTLVAPIVTLIAAAAVMPWQPIAVSNDASTSAFAAWDVGTLLTVILAPLLLALLVAVASWLIAGARKIKRGN